VLNPRLVPCSTFVLAGEVVAGSAAPAAACLSSRRVGGGENGAGLYGAIPDTCPRVALGGALTGSNAGLERVHQALHVESGGTANAFYTHVLRGLGILRWSSRGGGAEQ
jgi:hypothetical protein